MDRLEAMATFVQVVEAGSISAAAQRLGIAKSAISRRIADLEARLRVQLFRRSTRSLGITDSGRQFYERCRLILADIDQAEAATTSSHGRLQGPLRLAAPLSFGLLHLAPAITDFMRLHPGVEFDLDLNDRRVDLLHEGFDLAVRIGDLPNSNLVARGLAPIQSMVCAAPALLERRGRPATPSDLSDCPCLVYSNASEPARWSYRDPGGVRRDVTVAVRARANNGDILKSAALAGEGFVLLPTFLVYRELAEGALEAVLRDREWPRTQAYALYPQTRHLSQRVRVFIDFLVERFEATPYWDASLSWGGPGSAPPGRPSGG